MDFDCTPRQREIYETVGELGRTRFAARAADYDAKAATPLENLKDLVAAGYGAAALSEEIGGLGGGALDKDPLVSLLVVEQTARYCLSTAQCTSTTTPRTASTRSAPTSTTTSTYCCSPIRRCSTRSRA
ncbi:hypothetical protein GCM10023144_13520 [Pigmentiphaga soli]|uniref:Acyl-CoA dehydrogenase/oxidase N-terminal domain-containing protein n=1 Tax=Pigmentiphaga soli TaxID=1007095 RepID=A0ABP8GPP4_9BURK